MIKRLARTIPLLALAGICLCSGEPAAVQTTAAAAPAVANPVEATRILDELLALCSGKPVFTATLRLMFTGSSGLLKNLTLDLPFSTQNGQIRCDLDLGKIKLNGNAEPAVDLTAITGSQVTILANPGQRTACLVFPSLKALVELTAPPPLTGQTEPVDTTPDVPETVAGYECRKSELHFTGSKDNAVVLTVWQAVKLEQFPIKMQLAFEPTGVDASLQEVRLQAPDPAQFKLPEGYARYRSMQELMAAVLVQKMMNPPK